MSAADVPTRALAVIDPHHTNDGLRLALREGRAHLLACACGADVRVRGTDDPARVEYVCGGGHVVPALAALVPVAGGVP